jgi:C-5 cytosine-specific DNA methylase
MTDAVPIPSLDLFSGIGGFALALKDIAHPVTYCEIDQGACDILKSNMARGRLPIADIHDDVRTLHAPPECKILTAGFPCQDFSTLNRNPKGLDGARSGLFKEIIRIVRESQGIRVVCLENSPAIVNIALDEIVGELNSVGFNVTWGVFAASEVGAPHRRRRWFCLASRGDVSTILRHFTQLDDSTVDWGPEPCTRVIPFESYPRRRQNRQMLYALGNAVVPLQAKRAFKTLAHTCHLDVIDTLKMPITATIHRIFHKSTLNPDIRGGSRECIRAPIKYNSRIFESPNFSIIKQEWPTPTASQDNQARTLTTRTAQFFKIAIFYERDTRTYMNMTLDEVGFADRKWMINPAFVAYIMGYPIDWTSA